VIAGRKQASEDAQGKYLADVALAANFDSLLDAARTAENEFRAAQAVTAPVADQYARARKLDTALTDVMRSAYAATRAEIGPFGYDDRIYRRKAMAKPAVHALNTEAERLLTLRETHRLTGMPPRPHGAGVGLESAPISGAHSGLS
jgi:hypothetical protein